MVFIMENKINKIIEYTEKKGGCTFNSNLDILENLKGYTISLQKYEYKTTIKNVAEIEGNIKSKMELIRNKKNYVIGTWIDDGILYIDINKIEMNYTRACEFGKSQKQLAIFDNVNKKSIYLKKDMVYILYEYKEKINDIEYITEFSNKKELVNATGFYEFRNVKKYVYKSIDNIKNYYIRNGQKYIVIEEEV